MLPSLPSTCAFYYISFHFILAHHIIPHRITSTWLLYFAYKIYTADNHFQGKM